MRSDAFWIDSAYARQLAAVGLDRVEAALSRLDDEIVAWSRSTDTLRCARAAQPALDSPTAFYMKRYCYASWSSRIRSALRGTLFGKHRAAAEAGLLRSMRSLGIPAVRPVAHGARRVFGFVTASILITEETPGATNLTSFARAVAAGERVLAPDARRRLVVVLAKLVKRMHSVGFSHGQLFWRNFLVRVHPSGEPEFFVLDPRPGMGRHGVRRGSSWRTHELAQLYVSAMPFTTPRERMRFFKHYLARGIAKAERRALLQQIELRSAAWSSHEARRILMNNRFAAWKDALAREKSAMDGSVA